MGCCCSANEKLEARIEEHLSGGDLVRKDVFWPNMKYHQVKK